MAALGEMASWLPISSDFTGYTARFCDSSLGFALAPFGIWGSYGALFICILIALTKNYDVFVGGGFGTKKYKTFITGYIGVPIYLALIFGHKTITKSRRPKAYEVDLYTGKDAIDREEEAFLAHQAAQREVEGTRSKGRLYKNFISWLF
ncbi:hypothetical protein FPSE_07806 [Fusarium pseudograminearum CS3096]|uniref:Amino acid permease/ SLC12A domain-containing protein n=1 Tax=Fusarium pseudograminearum (strain CS3096) TaxID=1028729 RepID=K3VDY2_FUSPC|nr:hypothetical protein FPSE_07806 [Fusarium pseudograminearum CS3096]EKJ72019.1 hypothetical protein FPSE_07806 [Fusarium pseudograminearum CS3096]